MRTDEFDRGIKILQASFRKQYPDDSYKELWREFSGSDGDLFIQTCDVLKREGVKLPILAEIVGQYGVFELERRQRRQQEEFMRRSLTVSRAEFEATSKMLKEITQRLKKRESTADGGKP